MSIRVEPSAYRVCGLPDDHIDADTFQLRIAWRGGDLWAVMRGPFCLSRTREWDYEMQPSSRTDEWLLEHRWSLAEATQVAVDVYPTVTINGWRVRHGELVRATPDVGAARHTTGRTT